MTPSAAVGDQQRGQAMPCWETESQCYITITHTRSSASNSTAAAVVGAHLQVGAQSLQQRSSVLVRRHAEQAHVCH